MIFLFSVFCVPGERAEAMTYTRLVEAIREQRLHPEPEADAKVRQTQIEAALFQSAFFAVPVLLIGYLVVRLCMGRRKG